MPADPEPFRRVAGVATPVPWAGPGAYEERLGDSARRYTFWFRSSSTGLCCWLGAMSGGRAAWVVAAVVIGLTALRLPTGCRAPGSRAGPVLDVVLAAALGAAQLHLGPATTSDWLFAVIAILSVTCHYEWPSQPRVAWVVALVAIGSYAVFHQVSGGPPAPLPVLRLFAQSALGFFGLRLLRTAARHADREAGRAADSRVEAETDAVRRRAERDWLAVLHDTACTTLLAVATSGDRNLGWVRRQCGDDLRVLTRVQAPSGTVADLADLLRGVRGHLGLQVRLAVAGRLPVAGDVADAIARGVTEALTNVARHSGDRHPAVSASSVAGRVTVVVEDAGAGFVPAAVSPAGRGIRESVVRRAESAGVAVTVRSAPGRGTRIEWTADIVPTDRTAVRPAVPDGTGEDLLRRIRLAVLTVCLVVQFGLTAPSYARQTARGLTTPVSAVVFCCLAAVGAGCWLQVARGRTRPAWTAWAGAALLLACSAAMALDLPADVRARGEHWAFGLVGWYSLVVLFDAAIIARLLFLALHVTIFMAPVMFGPEGLDAGTTMGVFVVSVTGMQAGVALAAGAVHVLAGQAWTHLRETHDLLVARRSANVAMTEQRRRYAEIRLTTVPLLEELAAGRLDPATVRARTRCAVEAARLRRLMSPSKVQDDQLTREVRAVADDLERRGVRIELSIKGAPVGVPEHIRGALLDPVVTALVAARTAARLTVLHDVNAVRLSALCTGVPDDWAPPAVDPRIRVSSTRSRDTVWLEAAWTDPT